MSKPLPQKHCRNTTDHPGHPWYGRRYNVKDQNEYRCPGRYTPSAHRAPDVSPAQPDDPFAGIDEAYGY